ncbi:BspA family leucine-rich repeat surface protein, partial [Slackia piriformis]|uniref:BspA family leucine-rich repeat surface protein n=1 Tax=Slackia piriformis TaxID=626934 RepID=UPI002942CD69
MGILKNVSLLPPVILFFIVVCFAGIFAPLSALATEDAAVTDPSLLIDSSIQPIGTEGDSPGVSGRGGSSSEGSDEYAAGTSDLNADYALLYADGTLVIQNGNTPDPANGELIRTYGPCDWGSTSLSDPFWYSDVDLVHKIVIADPVTLLGNQEWFSKGFFADFNELVSIEGLEKVDVSSATDMSGMFSGCSSLESLDLSGWDTSSATDMSGMFSGCSSLSSLDLSSFDTSCVTDMSSMFGMLNGPSDVGCSSLESLDLSGWDTSSVSDMSEMF